MDAAVVGLLSLLGVAIGVLAQQLQAKRNRQWQEDDSARSHRWEHQDLLNSTKRIVYAQYLRSIDASYAQADAGVRTRSEDEEISTAVAEIELLSGPEISGRVRSHSKKVLSVHDKLAHATDKTAIREDVLAADKERMNLIALFRNDLGINDEIGVDKPRPLTKEEFENLWMMADFKEIVRSSATGDNPLRYRRMVMEGKVAAAQYDMVRWTKIAVLAAISTSILSLIVTVILALTRNS